MLRELLAQLSELTPLQRVFFAAVSGPPLAYATDVEAAQAATNVDVTSDLWPVAAGMVLVTFATLLLIGWLWRRTQRNEQAVLRCPYSIEPRRRTPEDIVREQG